MEKGLCESDVQLFENLFATFLAKTEDEIANQLGISVNHRAKGKYETLANGMIESFDYDSRKALRESNIKIKSIHVSKNGTIKESMSFPCFDFVEVVGTPWEDSEIRSAFYRATFLLLFFQETENGSVLARVRAWKMQPVEIETHVKAVYLQLQKLLRAGQIVKEVSTNKSGKQTRQTYFPGQTDNPMVHIRPHARDANDTYRLPVPDQKTGATHFTKQCFWINRTYLMRLFVE